MKMTDKIRRLLKKGKTAKEIALALKIEPNRVHTVKWLDGKKKDNIRAKKWAKKNSWFGVDKKKTAKALEAHEDLMNRGVHPTKQPKKYWAEVDKAMKPKKPKKPSKIIETARITKAELDALLPKPDLVNHPPHYKSGGIETIDFIEAKDLNYRLGNVVKYVSRAGRKDSDPVQDLEKAAWYLKREIDARKRA